LKSPSLNSKAKLKSLCFLQIICIYGKAEWNKISRIQRYNTPTFSPNLQKWSLTSMDRHTLNTLPKIVHGQVFCIITWYLPIEWSLPIHHQRTWWAGLWVEQGWCCRSRASRR
jgi:hypothetical protein